MEVPNQVFILDNGAHSIKFSPHPISLSNPSLSTNFLPPIQIPNFLSRPGRPQRLQPPSSRSLSNPSTSLGPGGLTAAPTPTYVGDELDRYCDDFTSLTYKSGFERGLLVNWEVQKRIWDWVVGEREVDEKGKGKGKSRKIEPSSLSLIVTEPPLNLPNIQETYDQMIFEEYQFGACWRTTSALLSALGTSGPPPPKDPTPEPGQQEQDDNLNQQTPHSRGRGRGRGGRKSAGKSRLATKAARRALRESYLGNKSLVDGGDDDESDGGFVSDGMWEGEREAPECVLVVDSGYSFTHVVPVLAGEVVWSGVRRIDIGGKLLTNHLKELISFVKLNVMDQTHLMGRVKERCCYVANTQGQTPVTNGKRIIKDGIEAEIQTWKSDSSSIVQHYVLPDYSSTLPPSFQPENNKNKTSLDPRYGHIQEIDGKDPFNENNDDDEKETDEEQILLMDYERFSVPEVLWQPGIVGLNQGGLSDCIAESISSLPEDSQGMFWANILCVGGNASLPGFRERLMKDLRPVAPDDCEIMIRKAEDPLASPYLSARTLLNSSSPHHVPNLLKNSFVTREEYLEHGSNICRRRFTAPVRRRDMPTLRRSNSRRKSAYNRQQSAKESEDVSDQDQMELDQQESKDVSDTENAKGPNEKGAEGPIGSVSDAREAWILKIEEGMRKARMGRTLNDDEEMDWEKDLSTSGSDDDDYDDDDGGRKRKAGGKGKSGKKKVGKGKISAKPKGNAKTSK